jgi:hypothetical protein
MLSYCLLSVCCHTVYYRSHRIIGTTTKRWLVTPPPHPPARDSARNSTTSAEARGAPMCAPCRGGGGKCVACGGMARWEGKIFLAVRMFPPFPAYPLPSRSDTLVKTFRFFTPPCSFGESDTLVKGPYPHTAPQKKRGEGFPSFLRAQSAVFRRRVCGRGCGYGISTT